MASFLRVNADIMDKQDLPSTKTDKTDEKTAPDSGPNNIPQQPKTEKIPDPQPANAEKGTEETIGVP
jgi:hypothetical protein